MSDIEPDLIALGKTLEQRFALHLRGSGHTYGYWLHESASGRRIASKSVWRGKFRGKQLEHIVYTMGDDEFVTAEAFLKAYRQRLRDQEFDNADPAKKETAP